MNNVHTIIIEGTDNYKNSRYCGRDFDKHHTVVKYEHDYVNDTYTIVWKEK